MEQEQSLCSILTDHAMLVVWGQFAHCMGFVLINCTLNKTRKSGNIN
jgi:hypothetical protein